MPVVNDCAEYDLGDTVTVFADFSDPNSEPAGEPLDPTAVFLQVLLPAYGEDEEELLEYEYGGIDAVIMQIEEGKYKADIDASRPGEFVWRWYSTGIGKAADEGNFRVRKSRTLGQV